MQLEDFIYNSIKAAPAGQACSLSFKQSAPCLCIYRLTDSRCRKISSRNHEGSHPSGTTRLKFGKYEIGPGDIVTCCNMQDLRGNPCMKFVFSEIVIIRPPRFECPLYKSCSYTQIPMLQASSPFILRVFRSFLSLPVKSVGHLRIPV